MNHHQIMKKRFMIIGANIEDMIHGPVQDLTQEAQEIIMYQRIGTQIIGIVKGIVSIIIITEDISIVKGIIEIIQVEKVKIDIGMKNRNQ
jgi:hypothetical protein